MLIAATSQYFFGPLYFFLSLFLILLILVQRGKGGGLTGALGGPGGQSAFGTKAGDLFTRITIVIATIWIVLLAFGVWLYTDSGVGSALSSGGPQPPAITLPDRESGMGGNLSPSEFLQQFGPQSGGAGENTAGAGDEGAASIDAEVTEEASVADDLGSPTESDIAPAESVELESAESESTQSGAIDAEDQ